VRFLTFESYKMMNASLLLEIGMPFRRGPLGLMVEAQALNGMRLWAKHFDHVTVCATEMPASMPDSSTVVWADPSPLLAQGRLRFEPLPWGYHPRDHFRYRSQVRRRFDELIADHQYLCFSNLGAFGAWGNFAAASARQQKRPYSLWFDWVLHAMSAGESSSLKRRLKESAFSRLVKHQTFKAIRGSALGLFHGRTVYDAYAPLCRQSELVHDVHVHPEDAISNDDLGRKVVEQATRTTLRIGYIGRVHPMKAPMQWIDAVAAAVGKLGVGRLEATWLGDGPLLDEARLRVRELGLEHSISFAGFVSNREQLLHFLRQQDLMVFCHITPESPRCLLESLISGTPLVGYESAYARELVGQRGGAVLTPLGDTSALASVLTQLADDRKRLSDLALGAGSSRALYNDEAVFAHRSELIKRYLV
jgi:colanic acid/amylovoran biosynthesis glycosyltransferase